MKRMYDMLVNDNLCDLLSDIAEYVDNEQGVCLRKFLEIRYKCPDVVENCYQPYDCKKCIQEFMDQDI